MYTCLSGLGGMFMLQAGKVKFHVMPDFSATALCSDADVDAWLHYFEMNAPITNVGTLVTGDHVTALTNLILISFLIRKILVENSHFEVSNNYSKRIPATATGDMN